MDKPGVVMVNDVSLIRLDAPTLHTIEVARAFHENGFVVDLVARGPNPDVDGVRFHGGPPFRWADPRRIPVVNARAARVLWRRRRTAQVAYVREDWASVPAMAIARALGYRVISEVNDVRFGDDYQFRGEGTRSWLSDRVKRVAAGATWKLSESVIVVTSAIKDLILRDFDVDPAKIVVLPNGVNAEHVRPLDRDRAKREAGLATDARYVAFVGAIGARVAWDTFLRAFVLVVQACPDALLVIAGDGPEDAQLDALVVELGLGDKVIRTGFVDRPRAIAIMGAATVCLLAHRPGYQTRIGASSVKLTEYMAAGRAIVATDFGGVREMLDESGAGVIVPPDDPEAMAQAIVELLNDPAGADALGVAGRAAVEERWSWQAIGRQIAALAAAR